MKRVKKSLNRSISDVHDVGIQILGLKYAKQVNLSQSVFRTVNPIHIQFLKKMGVTATFGTNIVKGDTSWGMMIFHHYTWPKSLSFNNRLLSIFFSNGLSLWLQTIQVKEQNRL